MNKALTETERENGWISIEEGLISRERLEFWIKEYFALAEDLSNFKRRNRGGLELVSLDGTRGYVFIGEMQLERDHEKRMLEERRIYDAMKRRCIKSFSDFDQGISGFYWRT